MTTTTTTVIVMMVMVDHDEDYDDDDDDDDDDDATGAAPSAGQAFAGRCVSARHQLRAPSRKGRSHRTLASAPSIQKPYHWNALPMPFCGAAMLRSHFVRPRPVQDRPLRGEETSGLLGIPLGLVGIPQGEPTAVTGLGL